jgi:hypothetical protein
MPQIIKSKAWRYTVCIKDYLDLEPTYQNIFKVCTRLCKDLEELIEVISESNIVADEKTELINELESIISNLQMLSDLASGKIPEEKWDEYDFHGNFVRQFNNYIFELYELGDRRIHTFNNVSYKFIWVG